MNAFDSATARILIVVLTWTLASGILELFLSKVWDLSTHARASRKMWPRRGCLSLVWVSAAGLMRAAETSPQERGA